MNQDAVNTLTNKKLEIGLYSIGDYIHSDQSPLTEKERLKQIVELAQLAEDAGLDIFQLGESHQENFVSQAHLAILAAIAVKTEMIKLSSGATIIGAADPVRVIETARTIDLLSDERMELVLGRSARMGIFELFGYSLNDYEEIFEEKFDLTLKLNQDKPVSWSGESRKALDQVDILPHSERPKSSLPIWRANSGTLSSALKAGQAGVPLHLMQLRGSVSHYQSVIDQYKQEGRHLGHGDLPVATAGFLMVKENSQDALKTYQPLIQQGMTQVNGMDFNQTAFENINDLDNVMMIGSPDLIVEKILHQYEAYGHCRFVGQIDFGGLAMDDIKETIDLLATKVIPQVKKHLNP